jgi:hypothetical protein
VIAAIEISAKLGHFTHDAAMTMAAVLVLLVLMVYWILKTCGIGRRELPPPGRPCRMTVALGQATAGHPPPG